MSIIWQELKSRKLFKAATIYAAIAWGLIQIADILFPVVSIPEWVMSSMVLVAFAGFPGALIIGWMIDMRQDRRNARLAEDQAAGQISVHSKVAELAIISLFGVSAAALYYNSANEPVQASIAPLPVAQSLLEVQADQKSIAVLPFASFSDASQDEFFADGLAEELLNVLARNKKLRVAARTSSFQYKNTNVNVKTIAHELNVQYVLEGSVRRSGDLIRVTAQLIKADEAVNVFSKSWDRSISNVFEVQDEIAQSVLSELKISLLGENQSSEPTGTKNIAAFGEYSKGLAALRNRTKNDFEAAIVSFNKALVSDPNYAAAYAMLAETYLLQHSYGIVEVDIAIANAKPLVSKALELEPNLGTAHAVKGLMHWQLAINSKEADKEFAIAKNHLTKAIDINPSIAEAYMWYGSILENEGDYESGIKFRKKAFELDPQAAVVGYNRAKDLVRQGDYKEAMDVFNTVVRFNPNYPNAYDIAGEVSFQVGQLDQAYNMYNRLSELGDEDAIWLVNLSRIYIPFGEYALAQKNVDQLQKKTTGKFAEKFDWLQAELWIAKQDFESLKQWTDTFPEETKDRGELMWRGITSMNQSNWKFAAADFEAALQIIRENKKSRVDEMTVRVQLFLAKVYQRLGNQIEASNYINNVASEIETLKNKGININNVRFFQASLAALKDDNPQALALLRQAIQEGFVDLWLTETDPIFEVVRQDALYQAIRDEFSLRMKMMQHNIESQYGKLASLDT